MRVLPAMAGIFSSVFLVTAMFTSCGNMSEESAIDHLRDSLQSGGDSIILQLDSTGFVHIEKSKDGFTLKKTELGTDNSEAISSMQDYTINDGGIVFIIPQGKVMQAKRLDYKKLSMKSIGQPATTIAFNDAKDSLIFTNNGRSRKCDLTGKFDLEKEPGVCRAARKESKNANSYTDGSCLWGTFYSSPVTFLGKKGKLSAWDDGRFKCIIETPDGLVAIKNNGDTYLNDEKIGKSNVRITSKYLGERHDYNTIYTLTGKYTGENGEECDFSATSRIYMP